MNSLQFEVIQEEQKAKSLWNTFSPHKTLDDEWGFRDIFSKDFEFPFHFIVGYDREKPVGLLPLQRNTVKGLGPKLLNMQQSFLEFFAGIDADDNKVFLLPGYDAYEEEFYKQIKEPAVLTSLLKNISVNGVESEHYLDRYELDLTEFDSFESFMQNQFDGVSRQRLINRMNKLKKTYSVEIKDTSAEDLHFLFDFSIARFGERSSFHMPQRQQIYKDLFASFKVDLFMLVLDGIPKAISFGIIFNKIYTTVNIGYDYTIRDISKLLVVTQIQRAMQLGCVHFDAGQGENGWKEHFHLQKIPQYKLTLNG